MTETKQRPSAPAPREDASAGRVPPDSRPLAERLRRRIETSGPMTFCDWMAAALYDEHEGYYRRRSFERWGRAGDYRTSAERSRLFAATLARFISALHVEIGEPGEFTVLEAGGGDGRFAFNLLRTLRRDAPRVFESVRYVFDEAGEDARARAARLLAEYEGRVVFRSAGDEYEPLAAAVVFSNELIDAMPIHRVRRRGRNLRELYVDVNARGEFVWTEREPSSARIAEHFGFLGVELADGHAAEINLEVELWLERVARAINRGFIVTVDYGDEAEHLFRSPERREGTLRAFRNHKFVDEVLRDPGQQDLTTTVNWTHLKKTGERLGLRTLSLERQDAFLLRAGLLEQHERERTFASDEAEVARLGLDAREMVLPGGMATYFQVLTQVKT